MHITVTTPLQRQLIQKGESVYENKEKQKHVDVDFAPLCLRERRCQNPPHSVIGVLVYRHPELYSGCNTLLVWTLDSITWCSVKNIPPCSKLVFSASVEHQWVLETMLACARQQRQGYLQAIFWAQPILRVQLFFGRGLFTWACGSASVCSCCIVHKNPTH